MRKDKYDRWHAVCASCLRWVDIASMDIDHMQALSILKAKLMKLAEVMATDPRVYDDLDKAATSPSPVSRFFIVKGNGSKRTFKLSEEGLSAYSHNMGNLIKTRKACNQGSGKHGGSLRAWLHNNPFFGLAFAAKFSTGPGTSRVVERPYPVSRPPTCSTSTSAAGTSRPGTPASPRSSCSSCRTTR